MKKRIKKLIILPAIAIILLYVGSYCLISITGTYRIYGFGLNGHYGYLWTPNGYFNKFNEINKFPAYFFYPLLSLDRSFLHKHTYFPPMPPPFTQDDIIIASPVFYNPPAEWVKEGDTTKLLIKIEDSKGRQFTIIRFRSRSGFIPRSPIYIIPESDNAHIIEVLDQKIFYERVYDYIEDKPEPKDALNSDSAAAKSE